MAIWAIKKGYRYKPFEVVRETKAMISYRDGRDRRGFKDGFVDWRGSEVAARALAEKLTSADAERDRRMKAARDWHRSRVEELTRDSDGSPKGEDA